MPARPNYLGNMISRRSISDASVSAICQWLGSISIRLQGRLKVANQSLPGSRGSVIARLVAMDVTVKVDEIEGRLPLGGRVVFHVGKRLVQVVRAGAESHPPVIRSAQGHHRLPVDEAFKADPGSEHHDAGGPGDQGMNIFVHDSHMLTGRGSAAHGFGNFWTLHPG